jgi:hypothetical protein
MKGFKSDIITISSNFTCSRHDIAENCSFGVKEQSLAHFLYDTGFRLS